MKSPRFSGECINVACRKNRQTKAGPGACAAPPARKHDAAPSVY